MHTAAGASRLKAATSPA